jgi:hypothetical protein
MNPFAIKLSPAGSFWLVCVLALHQPIIRTSAWSSSASRAAFQHPYDVSDRINNILSLSHVGYHQRSVLTTRRRSRKVVLSMTRYDSEAEEEKEEPQSAFLSLLEVSSVLASSTLATEPGSSAALPSSPSSSSIDSSNIYYQPALQLAVGAAKAFAAVERKLMQSMDQLGSLNDSLRKMALDQSKFVATCIEESQQGTTSTAAPLTMQAAIDQSVAAVQTLVAMDQRLSAALSDLYKVTASLKKVEADNNNFLSLLIAKNQQKEGSMGISNVDLKEQATATARAFDEIDIQLSEALAEIRDLGSSFKAMETKTQQNLSVPTRELSRKEPASSQSIPADYAPFSPLSESTPPPQSQPLPTGYAPFSPLPVSEIPTPPPPKQVRPDTLSTGPSPLEISIAAASAFHHMDGDMVQNDHQILGVLSDLKASLQRLVLTAPAPAPPTSQSSAPQLFQSAAPLPEPLHTLPPPSSLPAVAVDTRPNAPTQDPLALQKAAQLSRAAADAFDSLNDSMMKNNNQALSLLQELSGSFRSLCTRDDLLSLVITSAPAMADPSHPPIQPVTASPPMPTAPTATPAFVATTPVSTSTNNEEWENALILSVAAAQAFDKISSSMSANDDAMLAQLYELRDSFQRLAAADFPNFPFARSPKEEVPPVMSEPATTTTAVTATPSPVPFVASRDEPPSSPSPDHTAIAKARELSVQASNAFTSVDTTMTENDERTLALLREINLSFQKLSQTDHGLSSLMAPTPQQPRAVTKFLQEPVSAPLTAQAASSPLDATPMPANVPSVKSSRTNDVALARARLLSLEAAHAFQMVDDDLRRNNEHMITLLQEINTSFAQLTDNGLSSLMRSPVSSKKPGTVQELASPVMATAPPARLSTSPLEVPPPQSARSDDSERALEKAKQLSEDAARAFEAMDRAMTTNDEQLISLHQECDKSFEALTHAVDDLSSLFGLQPDSAPVNFIPKASTATPTSPAAKTVETAPTQLTLSAQNEMNLMKARQLSLNAAAAFREMDSSMVANDESTFTILREISANFACLADLDGLPPLRGPSTMPQPSPRPEKVVPNTIATSPPLKHAMPSRASPSMPRLATSEENSLALMKARQLSLNAAIAFEEVDTFMIEGDERNLAILQGIRSSFSKLAEVDAGLSSLVRPTTAKDSTATVSEAAALASPSTTPDRAPVPSSITLEAEASVQQEDLSLAKARQLAFETGQALNDLDDSMTTSDEKNIAVLNGIRESFQRLASLEGGLSSLFEAPRAPLLTVAPMPEMTHSSTMATKSPPALEPTKDHEALRISSIELSNAAAQAFDKMDRDMCSSDAEILDEFRKMRGLFAELAKGDASLFTESKTSQEDRPADRESQQQGKEVLRHSDVLRQKVQRAISAAEALRELEASKPTPHQPSLAILQEAIDSLRDLLSVKESFGGLGVNQRQVQIGKYKSTTGELVLRFLDHHFFFFTNQSSILCRL